jgi:hypothetical protein
MTLAAGAHFKNSSIFLNQHYKEKNQPIFKTKIGNRQSLNYTPKKRVSLKLENSLYIILNKTN